MIMTLASYTEYVCTKKLPESHKTESQTPVCLARPAALLRWLDHRSTIRTPVSPSLPHIRVEFLASGRSLVMTSDDLVQHRRKQQIRQQHDN